MIESTPKWHTLTAEEALDALQSTASGLSNAEAAQRLDRFGPNQLAAAHRVSAWRVFTDQLKSALVIILLIATALSAILGHAIESAAIAVIVGFSILLGFAQEYRAEHAIALLRTLTAPTAAVLRDGAQTSIPASSLVPGDVVSIQAGDKIPADARLLSAVSLQIDESSLTGESQPVEKQIDPLRDAGLAVADWKNSLFLGTTATFGRGTAVVVATGTQSQFGRISNLLATLVEPKTPLQRNLDQVGRLLAIVALLIVTGVVAVGVVRGEELIEMLIFGIALAVAVVPEALPAVVTISLALGVQHMAKNNALMRNLPAVETLGSTTVVCSDKTGTLTKDQMTVRKMFVDGKLVEVTGSGYQPEGRFLADGDEIQPLPGLELLLSAGSLASDAALNCDAGTWHAAGDPSEAALVTVAAKAGLDKTVLEREQPRVAEIPFSSERKRMTTLHSRSGVTTAYCKGAPEVILADCDRQRLENRELPLTDQSRHAILEVGRTLASEALRILAVAYKPAARVDDAETGMVFLGLLGLMDPPREEAAAAIRTCHEAGIRPIMITGDHPDTGAAIARELGLLTDGRILTGAELQTMTNAELERDVDKIEVYARVSPEQKIRVVDAWQRHGAVVAVTGDGINDAPALKKADIGIAMGITGTDVSREAADMTLIDDNFASIISAIAEGRRIFSNIKKFLMYLLSANIGEIGLMAMAAFAGLPLPLTAVQILYVNLATDGFPALALAVDPPAPGLMRRRPRDPRRSIFTRPVVTLMLVGGSWSACANFALFNVVLRSGRPVEEAMALTFISLVLIQLFQVYNFRSDRRSVIESPFGNRWLNLAVLGDLVLLGLIVYVPLLHEPLGTFTLNGTDWLLVIGVASTVVPALELTKLFIRKGMAGSLD